MNRVSKLVFGVAVLWALSGEVSPSQAQTTANGPYYATPSWDQTLQSSTRFIVLSNFAGQAVLDRETGIVWEKSPTDFVGFTWAQAQSHCATKSVGNRRGWKLPSIQELASLMDPSATPTLPAGHPFTVSVTSIYWSSTTYSPNNAAAWIVFFGNGASTFEAKTNGFSVWCARGGSGVDAQ